MALFLATLTLSSYAAAQLAGQTVQFETVYSDPPPASGLCIGATSSANGSPVIITNCSASTADPNTSWVVPKGTGAAGPLKIFGDKCIDVTNGVNADGTKLQVWDCFDDNTNQMWIPAGEDEQITWAGTNKCIDLTDGNLTPGNQIQVWTCADGPTNDNQKWNHNDLTEPKSFTIALQKAPNLCIAASSSTSNASVIVETCSPGSVAQTWTDPQNIGFIRTSDGSNLCVQPLGGNALTSGLPLVLVPCATGSGAGGSSQGWNHYPTGGIINNHAFGFDCIDLTNGNETPGTQLQQWDCTSIRGGIDNTNQDWVVTPSF